MRQFCAVIYRTNNQIYRTKNQEQALGHSQKETEAYNSDLEIILPFSSDENAALVNSFTATSRENLNQALDS